MEGERLVSREPDMRPAREDARHPSPAAAHPMEGERPREPESDPAQPSIPVLEGECPREPSPPRPQRKHPVHMPPVERHNAPVILFVTLTIQPRGSHLANACFREAFIAACGDADAWTVGFYLIMPDHIHLFCRPATEPRVGIKTWAQYLKRRITIRLRESTARGDTAREDARPPVQPSAHPMGGERPREPQSAAWRWQSDCWDTQIRSGEHYHEKWDYVRLNPVRRNLVSTPEDWPWQGVLGTIEWA